MVGSGPAGYRYTVDGALQLHVRQARYPGIGNRPLPVGQCTFMLLLELDDGVHMTFSSWCSLQIGLVLNSGMRWQLAGWMETLAALSDQSCSNGSLSPYPFQQHLSDP